MTSITAFINFLQITLFISLLNSSFQDCSSNPLFLTVFLNSYTKFFIFLFSCFAFFNSATLTNLLSSSLNSCFRLVRKSPTTGNYKLLFSKSSITFYFQMFANSPTYMITSTKSILLSKYLSFLFLYKAYIL